MHIVFVHQALLGTLLGPFLSYTFSQFFKVLQLLGLCYLTDIWSIWIYGFKIYGFLTQNPKSAKNT
jgi:hypothetical protein